MSICSKTVLYRKQSKALENYERVLNFYYSAVLDLQFYLIHNREFIFNAKAEETTELYCYIHLVS